MGRLKDAWLVLTGKAKINKVEEDPEVIAKHTNIRKVIVTVNGGPFILEEGEYPVHMTTYSHPNFNGLVDTGFYPGANFKNFPEVDPDQYILDFCRGHVSISGTFDNKTRDLKITCSDPAIKSTVILVQSKEYRLVKAGEDNENTIHTR